MTTLIKSGTMRMNNEVTRSNKDNRVTMTPHLRTIRNSNTKKDNNLKPNPKTNISKRTYNQLPPTKKKVLCL